MIKRLRKVGNSNALLIDKALMEIVGLDDGDEARITVRNGSIIITPVRRRRFDPKRFERFIGKTLPSRRNAIRKLVK